MQDQQITGHITRQWMDYMREYSSDQELEEWIRYFRVSGMLHCSGGVGKQSAIALKYLRPS
jgi:hypothetical protein